MDFFVNNPKTQEVGLTTGIEVNWDITDSSNLVIAHSQSTAEAQPDGQKNISRSDVQAAPLFFTFEVRDDVASHFYDNEDISIANARIWQYDGYSDPRKDEIDQARLDYTFTQDTFTIKAGAMFTDQTKTIQQYTTLVLHPNWSVINEETTSFYVEGTKSYDLSGHDLTLVAGVRYEDTKIASTSLGRTLVSLTPPAVEGENYVREFTESVPFTDGDGYDVFMRCAVHVTSTPKR